jgi:hypothetical protein
MCHGNVFFGLKNSCRCKPEIDDRFFSKQELLAQLKEYKKDLESELDTVNRNLESTGYRRGRR